MRRGTILGELVRETGNYEGVCGKATSFIPLVQSSFNMPAYNLAKSLVFHDESEMIATQRKGWVRQAGTSQYI